MPDYSEYILIKNEQLTFHNHYRGDYTFLCDVFWGEQEAKRIISKQVSAEEFKGDNPFTRIIIDEDRKDVHLQIEIPEYKNGAGILTLKKYLELLQANWDGWSVKHLENGYYDVMRLLARYDQFGAKRSIDRILDYVPAFLKQVWDEPQGTLLSRNNGKTVEYGYLAENVAPVIAEQEGLLDRKLENFIPTDRLPHGGIHIDQKAKKIQVWYTITPYNFEKWVQSYWPNWEVTFDFWGFENHYKLLKVEKELKEIENSLQQQTNRYLTDHIVNCDREPYFDFADRTYKFKERERTKQWRKEKFEELWKKCE